MDNQTPKLNTAKTSPAGTVLIVVIWIVLILASLVIVLSHFIRTEAMAASNHVSRVKAEAVANGAVQYIIAQLNAEDESQISYTEDPYEAVEVAGGYFWVLKPDLSDDRHYQFGLTDEAGKVNLNEASLETLLKLPGMTDELANAIIDWKDENQEVSAGGAESEYYLLLSEPYQCKNAPLETVEEVLLIKGGTSQLLYGEDTNRNGILDWNENDSENAGPSDNGNGALEPGFFNYVTIHSYEVNTDSDGEARINISDNSNRAELAQLLTETFGEEKALQIIAPIRLRNFNSLIEFYYFIGMEYDDFLKIIDRLATSDDEQVAGRINVNTAPEEVLLCLPQLEQTDVDELIAERAKTSTDLESILWVTKVLDQVKALAIGSFITVRSSQYSADIVAVSGDGRSFCRYYVVIDTATEPTVVYKQLLYHAGWPLDPKILESLRGGNEL